LFETLRIIFFAAAILCGMLFILAIKNHTGRAHIWFLVGVVLAVMGVAVIIINNIRLNNNKKALESSTVVTTALEDITPILLSDHTFSEIKSDGQVVQEPYVLVPIEEVYNRNDRTKDTFQITNKDSCWSGGQFISTEQADKCKTIAFYTTFTLEMPYKSTNGSTTTGKSESKTIYLYDVQTRTVFAYEYFSKTLPSITEGTPNMKIDTQDLLKWINEHK
jgi:hypothetical protein